MKFFLFVLKFLLFLSILVFTKDMPCMNRTQSRRGHLILHWQYMVYLRYTVLCWYANIAKWTNVLNMGYTNPKSFGNLVHYFWKSVPPCGYCSNQLSAWLCALTTSFVGLGIISRRFMGYGGMVPRGEGQGEGDLNSVRMHL